MIFAKTFLIGSILIFTAALAIVVTESRGEFVLGVVGIVGFSTLILLCLLLLLR